MLWRWILALSWAVLLLVGGPAEGAEGTGEPEVLASYHALWLETVSPLLSETERARFEALDDAEAREAFIAGFWRSRDPTPGTPDNDFRELWERNARLGRELFGSLDDDRARALVLIGARPQKVHVFPCPAFQIRLGDLNGDGAVEMGDLRVWVYPPSWVVPYGRSEPLSEGFSLVFVERCTHPRGPRCQGVAHRLWTPEDGSLHGLPGEKPAEMVVARMRAHGNRTGCFAGDAVWEELAAALRSGLGWEGLEERLGLADLRPHSDGWIDAALRDLRPASADLATLRLGFPARTREGTVLEGVVGVSQEAFEVAAPGETERAALALEGEVFTEAQQVDRFSYRYHLPLLAAAGDQISLSFHRRLPPGSYGLVVRLFDNEEDPLWRETREIRVPDLGKGTPTWSGDPDLLEALAVDAAPERHEVQLVPPGPGLYVGPVELEVAAYGPAVSGVELWLDGERAAEDGSPPYRFEVDLGEAPRSHALRAVAVDDAGRELARDEVRLNAGPHRFAVRLLAPTPGEAPANRALLTRVAVERPRDARIDRLELYLDDALAATLYQPPFVQHLSFPPGREPYFVRAVAYLEDGRTAEDTVFLHSSGEAEEIEVELVELYTTVLDREGRPVLGLTAEDFTVLDEGEEQPIHRFQTLDDVPIHVGLLMDVSDSMAPHLDQARESALRFFEQVLRPGDQAAVVAFHHRPRIVAAFTEHVEVLESSMVGLLAEGGTALYDSLVFALHYFGGLRGKRALVLLSDGEDQHSRATLSDALDYARRVGVAVYPIAIGSGDVRTLGREDPGLGRTLHKWVFASPYVRQLRRLARETGGRYFAVEDVADLDTVYRVLEEELRSQYLVTYHVPAGVGEGFRRVELRVADPELAVHTMGGYIP